MIEATDPYFARTKDLFRRLSESGPGAWDEHLPLAEAIVREANAERTGVTSFEAAALPFVSWAELKTRTPEEPDWILGRLIARGCVSLLAGKPKAGKSTLACAIAGAVDALARSFLGQSVDGEAVIYVSEEGAGTLAPKLASSGGSSVLDREAVWPKPEWSALIAASVAEAKRIGAGLIVLDSLSFWARFGEGQEKDAGAAQTVVDALGLATAAGLAVLLVHHQRKAGGEGGDAVRGSGAIFGAVDMLIEIERTGKDAPPSQRRLVTLGRWSAPPVLVIERGDDAAWRVIGEAETRSDATVVGYRERILRVLPSEAPGATEDEIAELLGVDRRKFGKPLRELVGDGVSRSGGGAKGNPYRYLRAPQNAPPESGENHHKKCSPSPTGGEQVREQPPSSPRGERKETLEDALLDPKRAEKIHVTVEGEWTDANPPRSVIWDSSKGAS